MKESDITDGENKPVIITDSQLAYIIFKVATDSFSAGCLWSLDEFSRLEPMANKYPSLAEYSKNINIKELLNNL